ncbi:histidine phosphatase family protein [Haematomicrobium sanguinis]|uniref:histidine phosphatase family protein n=1 Tax=Haematomicrobium sanguinis TaxID=479106 RepID=UPI00047BA195|nr:histidine phosphatase family protein [Haematomicrobium sanguinis]
MPLTTIHLIRHGEVHNPDKVLYGRLPDFHLSELGRRMAQGVARYFVEAAEAGRPWGTGLVAVYASPLERAQETAAPLAQAFGLPVREEPDIIEAENHFEGLSGITSELRNPRHWPYLVNPFRPSWGEAYRAQVARMRGAMERARVAAESAGAPHGTEDPHGTETPRGTGVAQREPGGAHIVMVSHQLPIWVTRLAAEGRPLPHDPRKRECTLTSITSFEFLDGALRSVRYHEPNAPLLAKAANLPGA